MIRSLLVVASACLTLGVGGALAVTDVESQLAEPAPETFNRVCSACHTPDLVMDRRLDRAGWEEVVHMMIGRGATASESETEEIIDYLAKTYPPRASVDQPLSNVGLVAKDKTNSPPVQEK